MNSLSSAPQLARFHAARSTLYRAIAYLIGAPANERSRGIARAILKDCPQHFLVKDALERALASRMTLADSAGGGEPCGACADRARCEAFRAAGRAEDDAAGSEAEVLSALADQSARALRQNDMTEAAKLAEVQHAFIAGHAGMCLSALAAALKERSSEYTRNLGEAIERLIESDQRMLG
jgi:hypothetical protein